MCTKFFLKANASLLILAGLVFTIMGCSQSYHPNIERGSDYKYRDGYPEVQLSAAGFIGQDKEPKIYIVAEIVYESLVFKDVDNQQVSNVSIELFVESKSEEDSFSTRKNYDIKIEKVDSISIASSRSYIFEKELLATPGSHTIHLTITDQNSGKRITRTDNISIPDPEKSIINLTDIRLLGIDKEEKNASWVPVTTYDVPSRIDSLMFRFQVTNSSSGKHLAIESELKRIKSDLSVARPIFGNNYSSSTIEHSGINYDKKTTLQKSTRELSEEGSVFIEYRFKQLERGNYRFRVQIQKNEQLFKARDFGVKSTNYPSLQTPRELARPLVYIMGDDEYQDLLAIGNPDSLKSAIDKFWLEKIGTKKEARQVLEKYYNRIEEANKQFSNFKEGWKTDPGMVYILFGPPWYIEDRLFTMTWYYSNNIVTSDRSFVFSQPKTNNKAFPFNHFLLQRDEAYYSLVYQQKQLWLSALILHRNL